MTPVTVTLSCAHDALDSTVEAVRATGLRVDQVLRNLGVVTGEVDPTKIAALREVDGVGAVEPAQGFTTPSPDDTVQ
ncbi:Ketohydroxyglutarate aldolase OS=Tsukamurella paurometabola (strain ATCC 8368 / DSM / CCUG 35730/ CIP 100753 / JCM 10117 / KCTC 9821 / NBRC 16120 / NCIMB 702349 / NCTC 13040) OX=521096 GN=Tpau_1298 PE=4 SV=1 [Tsukamurella paurometabola]|uniref:Ketohydroxyglutarate aldolase n=1 Tax=Tsukamurella paurometabola (strain ATCC 8368 / DSM 20162 / CCUG 35730 / CIP 100753 / JCM 10117 / KCTC 9821 / NBRC 16120 / NCIMB 702349 / NCTC 13040) TaxID=521096 RepID=D5UWQ5_TSUPD|nr:hypothetical protein [Tsukamurella paurometabola]ADG77927.1 conserved hypothetical protein [Tsukamurella paurometabola DSM 20162]SUP29392.1 Uncharacterised protein [Tsukamurella paurometabola]